MKDSEMIERVAQAIGDATDCHLAGAYAAARSAIAAMREPTEAMLYPDGERQIPYFDFHRNDDAKAIWQAMIDAALK